MPYDLFVKAQIAGDRLPDHEKYEAALGFYALSPEMQDDRVDATTRLRWPAHSVTITSTIPFPRAISTP
jgi:hypothetical protein